MTEGASDLWRRLLYRWFVQYNPLYLLSAMLVLGGTILTSRGLATEGSLYGPLGVAAIAEVYALALIGGAALLTRIGQRRPAVMLAVLTALYQCDLTLHTETCVQLGTAGLIATTIWLTLFMGKLGALAWAVRARLSRGAWALAALGAAGLAVGPYVIELGNAAVSGGLIASLVFALGLIAKAARVETTAVLDAWGDLVFQRTVKTIWGLFGVLFGLHMLFWGTSHVVTYALVVPALLMLFVRRVPHELMAWLTVSATIFLALVYAPSSASFIALLASIALALRAYGRVAVSRRVVGDSAESGPYRYGEVRGGPRWETVYEPLSDFARARHLTGALGALYLSLVSIGWHGYTWPTHSLLVDALILVLAIGMAFRMRPRLSLLVPAFGAANAVITYRLIPTPQTTLGWGATTLVLGFVLLAGALATSYLLRNARLTVPDA